MLLLSSPRLPAVFENLALQAETLDKRVIDDLWVNIIVRRVESGCLGFEERVECVGAFRKEPFGMGSEEALFIAGTQ